MYLFFLLSHFGFHFFSLLSYRLYRKLQWVHESDWVATGIGFCFCVVCFFSPKLLLSCLFVLLFCLMVVGGVRKRNIFPFEGRSFRHTLPYSCKSTPRQCVWCGFLFYFSRFFCCCAIRASDQCALSACLVNPSIASGGFRQLHRAVGHNRWKCSRRARYTIGEM